MGKNTTKADGTEILLVQDDLNDIDLTIRALKNHDLAGKVLVVKDGTEALEFLFATGAYANRSINPNPK